ncbi:MULTISPECIES: NUDIX hydrolase [Streptomyces]|uniref:NUDIX domain-containing protein n=1 Tax=Streptomyces xinghaiensis TaxID=1038928 RepID=A0A420V660_9ACTN|nr:MULTISPECIES: NUDIX hydrolase [Streptomyces]OFA62727.1 NUDIX hydrolase [Streptomyces fradiae]PQM24188.1 NUDIX domain-containing protein [Streptomyces xinghaiensis]RKM97152.1 NUDIX domain-containing protein [Streptomyces xinghaiensis]RNC75454.1 NUDIX domain-containing protein [Streptomyces xinghaiensis]
MSLHADATRVLENWSPRIPPSRAVPPAPGTPPPAGSGQEELRRDYLGHLCAHPDGMWKNCREGHITASALVVDPGTGRVLLTLHRKLEMWLQTGGHCEPEDTTLAGAALREATEESGIPGLELLPGGPVRLDRHRTPCAWHLDVQYAALAPAGSVEAVSEESLELRWYGWDEVPRVADASVVRLAEGTRALL